MHPKLVPRTNHNHNVAACDSFSQLFCSYLVGSVRSYVGAHAPVRVRPLETIRALKQCPDPAGLSLYHR
jgi:hypothetical protein